MINNSIPYLDFVFTEKFQADIIQKIKSIEKQFSHIEVRTIKELT